jgi:hypothetical protein
LCYLQIVVVEISPQLHSYIVQVVSEYLTMLHNTYPLESKQAQTEDDAQKHFPEEMPVNGCLKVIVS